MIMNISQMYEQKINKFLEEIVSLNNSNDF